jgi:hypothetical protein
MLRLIISVWQKVINDCFLAMSKEIIVNKNLTKEICNFEYCLIPELIQDLVKAPIEEEYIEREFVLLKSFEMGCILCKDINSRQAAFVNNYDSKDNHCISYFQFYIRENKLSMNIYVRSMNYDTNFVFDNQTFNLAYKEVYDLLKNRIKSGDINVKVFSLHKYIK